MKRILRTAINRQFRPISPDITTDEGRCHPLKIDCIFVATAFLHVAILQLMPSHTLTCDERFGNALKAGATDLYRRAESQISLKEFE